MAGDSSIAERLAMVRRILGRGGALREARGWATVELARAERDVARLAGESGPIDFAAAADDELLGARCRVAHGLAGGLDVAILEPFTEGRLAASLARFGEAFLVRYLLVPDRDLDRAVAGAAATGLAVSAEAGGPFGRSRLVLGGPAWGPHLLLVATSRPASRAAAARRAGTIGP